MNKRTLIHKLSEKTGYTQKDCKAVINAFIETLAEQISLREEFGVYGLGKVTYSRIKPRKAYKPRLDGSGEYIDVGESLKVLFSLAEPIRKGEAVLVEEFEEEIE